MITAHDQNNEYLQTLSLLSKTLKRDGVIGKLKSIQKPDEIFDLLTHEFESA